MTRYQTWILRWMRNEQHGAFRFRDRWIWPQDVRRDAELAERIYQFTLAPRARCGNDEAELLDEVGDEKQT